MALLDFPSGPSDFRPKVGLQTFILGLQTFILGLQTFILGLQTFILGLQTFILGSQTINGVAPTPFSVVPY